MVKSEETSKTSGLLLLGAVCLVVTALHLAQEVLVPLALAILFSFLLAPLVRRLERMKLPRAAAVILTVLLTFGLLAGIGYVVYDQLGDLTTRKAEYAQKIQSKMDALHGPGGIMTWWHNTTDEVKKMVGPTTQAAQSAGVQPATPVEVVNQTSSGETSSPLAWFSSIGTMLLGPVGTAFIVTVFTVFMLLQREDLRDRLIRLVGRDQLTLTTQALDDASERVSRYLMFQSIVNGGVGLIIAGALWLLGHIMGTPFPSPALWGLLAALLRFIPYVGIWISSLGPILLSLAVFSTIRGTLAVLGIYLVTELSIANAVEPLLFGSSTGIATLAVLVAAAFWTWLWGPVGLLLSTPLTVCLVVLGKYHPSLEFLTIILAEEPALSPPDRVYQRLMAMDHEEAVDLVEEYAKKMSAEELYDTVLLPVLATAEQDRHRGSLDDKRYKFIHDGVRDIVEERGDRQHADDVKARAQAQVDEAKGLPVTTPATTTVALPKTTPLADDPAAGVTRFMLPKGCVLNVVCLPAQSDADEIAGHMLAQLLQVRGYCVTVASVTQLASEMVATVETNKADAVVVSALPPAAVTHSRYLCKRLHGKLPDIGMIVGLWTTTGDLTKAKERIACVRTVQVAGGLRQAIDQVHQMVQPKLLG